MGASESLLCKLKKCILTCHGAVVRLSLPSAHNVCGFCVLSSDRGGCGRHAAAEGHSEDCHPDDWGLPPAHTTGPGNSADAHSQTWRCFLLSLSKNTLLLFTPPADSVWLSSQIRPQQKTKPQREAAAAAFFLALIFKNVVGTEAKMFLGHNPEADRKNI